MTYVKRPYYTRMLVAASNPSSDALAGQHVLVVDDHDVVHWGVRTLLRRQAWVARAWSARTARRVLPQTARAPRLRAGARQNRNRTLLHIRTLGQHDRAVKGNGPK